MAWIEAHQELPKHPKTKRFARMLKISIPEAVGHLFMFWWWALDYAENGDLSRYDAYDIADAAQWNGDPEEFLKAMIECGPGGSYGFIEESDGGFFVHDWEMYSGRLVEKREKNRQRQAKMRSQNTRNAHVTRDKHVTNKSVTHDNSVTNADVTRESQGYTTQHNTTQQDKTQHNSFPPLTPPTAAADAAEAEISLGRIIALWNEKLMPLGFSHVLKKTPSREKALAAMLETFPERKNADWWQKLFDRVALSGFLTKSVREQTWFTLDWLLNENNLVKLLEGKYDDKTAAKNSKKPVKSITEILENHENQSKNKDAIDAEYTFIKEGEINDGERSSGFL